jgi:RND family efflux transporter MFP subunit
MSHFFRTTSSCLLLATLSLAVGCQKAENKPKAEAKPPEVFYTTPVSQTVTEYEEFTGRIAPNNMAEVRARASGYLKRIAFADGQLVKAGDLLFEIDDRSFKAQVASAKATVSQMEARLDRLEKQVKRFEELMQGRTRAVTQEEFETVAADRNEAAASLQAAQAALELAETNLSYTKVEAPLSGRISRRLVDAGNLVTADATVLANIVATDPVYVYFDMNERTLLRIKRLVHQGEIKGTREAKLQVQIALADETTFDRTGIVNYVDNQVDPATGTLRYRAEIANPDFFYTPGLFVRLRFPVGQPHPALLVPEQALATDQGQRRVFVINSENKVETRPVVTGVLQDNLRVIREGVKSDDRIVVTGLQRLKKDAVVTPVDFQKARANVVPEPNKTAANAH